MMAVIASDPGETLMKVAAVKVFIYYVLLYSSLRDHYRGYEMKISLLPKDLNLKYIGSNHSLWSIRNAVIMYVMITSFVGLWTFRVILSFVLVKWFGIGLTAVMIGIFFDFSSRSAMYLVRMNKGKWK